MMSGRSPILVKKRCARSRRSRSSQGSTGLIVSSPLPRALQTAKIAAECLKAKLREDESLAPGFGMRELRTLLKRHRSKSLMLVGHEPDFTTVISKLTGASLKLSKAGVAFLDIDPESEKGRLLWLFPPKFARKAKS